MLGIQPGASYFTGKHCPLSHTPLPNKALVVRREMSYRHPLAQLLWGAVTAHTAPQHQRSIEPLVGGGVVLASPSWL